MRKKLLALIAVTGLAMSSWAVQPTPSAATAPPQSEFGYQFGTWAAYNLNFGPTWTSYTQIFFIGSFGAIGGMMGTVGGPIGVGLGAGLGSV